MKKIFLIFILGIAGFIAGSGVALAISAPNLITPADNAPLTPGDILFKWEPVPGAAAYYYRILNKTTGDQSASQDNYKGTEKTLPFSSVGTYKWQVGACEGLWPYWWPLGSCSAPSERTFTINLETLPKPTPTSPCSTHTTLTGTSLTPEMRWEWKGEELRYYSLEITGDLADGEKKRIFSTILQNYFLIPTSVLQNNKPYNWRIRATNMDYQETDWSSPCSFLTEPPTTPVPLPPLPPPRIDSISPNKGQWNKVTPIDIVGDNFDYLTCSNNTIYFNVGQGATGVTRTANPDDCPGQTTLKTKVSAITSGVTSANNIIKIKVSVGGKESNEVDFLLEGVVDQPGGGGPGQPSQLNVAWPRNPLGKDMPLNDLPKLIEYIYGWGISLAGFAAFIVLVIAGFQYLTSAGNPGKMQEAMDRIKSAGLGIVLLFGSILVLNTINPQLTQLKIPDIKDGSKVKDEIKIENAFTPCEGAKIYSQEKILLAEFTTEGRKSFPQPSTVGLVEIKGLCQVKLCQVQKSDKTTACGEDADPAAISVFSPTTIIADTGGGVKSMIFTSAELINLYKTLNIKNIK